MMKTKVFVSTTREDCRPHYQAVLDELSRMGVELVPDWPTVPAEVTLDMNPVKNAELIIFIVGFHYGRDLFGDGKSIIELEYEDARRAELPRLVFLAEEGYWPAEHVDENRELIHHFRSLLERQEQVHRFTTPNDIAAKVVETISRLRKSQPGAGLPSVSVPTETGRRGQLPNDAVPPFMSLSEIIDNARRFVSEMDALGIRPPPGSRVPLYLNAMEELESRPRGWIKGEDVRRYFFAFQEMGILANIFDSLKKPLELEGWVESFRKILRGPYFPGEGDDRARDTQAELQFAATAKRLGYLIRLAEPDLIIYDGAGQFGVAAKRPRSLEAINGKIRIAAGQIARTGLDGMIFLDLSVALAEAKREIISPQAKVAAPWQLDTPDKLPGFISRLGQQLRGLASLAKGAIPQGAVPRVFGISAFAVETVFIGSGPGLPPAHSILRWSNLRLGSIGERFYSDLEIRFEREKQPRNNSELLKGRGHS